MRETRPKDESKRKNIIIKEKHKNSKVLKYIAKKSDGKKHNISRED